MNFLGSLSERQFDFKLYVEKLTSKGIDIAHEKLLIYIERYI